MQTSKYHIGDTVLFYGTNGTITNVGVFGSKLSPNRVYVYEIDLDNGKHASCVSEWAIKLLDT